MSSEERRRFERHEMSVCVWLQFHHDQSVQGTTTVDLSPEGARFHAPKRVRPGQYVMIYLQLDPVAYTVECKGKVCWADSNPSGLTAFGVRFLDLEEEEHDRIAHVLHKPQRSPISMPS
ncbi:MAG: PilZ domain-containing protein [Candidatus Hydrogenedentota bacterium]